MSTDDVTQLSIIVSNATLSRKSFGIMLGLVGKVPAGWGTPKVRTFSKVSELTDLGFLTTDPAYKMATLIKSQTPSPKKFKLAKKTVPSVPSIQLKCLNSTQGYVYTFSIGLNNAAVTTITYTVLAAATTSTVATAIAALIAATAGFGATAAVNTITVTATTAPNLINVKGWDTAAIEVTDASADPGVAADLAAADAVDDDFYGVVTDCNSKLELTAIAAWTEANKRMCGGHTSDTVAKQSGTTDVGSALKTLGYKNAVTIYNGQEILGYSGVALLARCLAFDPGSLTFAFKDLTGVAVDALTTGEQTLLEGKNLNYYTSRSGASITYPGKVASGEFADVTHFLAWLDAELQLQLFQAIRANPKLPYTNTGLGAIEGTIKAVLKRGARMGGLIDDERLTVTMPLLDEIDSVTRANRIVPNIEFGGYLAGAIHNVQVVGTVKTG